jgi:hypothetical protein
MNLLQSFNYFISLLPQPFAVAITLGVSRPHQLHSLRRSDTDGVAGALCQGWFEMGPILAFPLLI